MDALYQWLATTSLSQWINSQSQWLWPGLETLHFIGLCLIVGVAGFFDCRLLGMVRGVPISAVKKFMPWALVGFSINLLTGILFFIAQPTVYTSNSAWWWKVLFLFIAGANALLFETTMGERLAVTGPDDDTPWSFKVIGAVSLLSWFFVLYFGRMLPFFGTTVTGL